jgi:DNA-directed RNA polymerase subunit RPC12/RpoP
LRLLSIRAGKPHGQRRDREKKRFPLERYEMTSDISKTQLAQQEALFGEASVAIVCPSCGHRMRRKIARLQAEPDVVCRNCGATVLININAGEFRDALHKELHNRRQ